MRLPKNEDAEEGLIGCMLLDSAVIGRCLEKGLAGDHFSNPQRQSIFEAIRDLHNFGEDVDEVGVQLHLNTQGEDGRAAYTYLTEIQKRVETTAHAQAFIDGVINAQTRRKLVLANMKFAERLQRPGEDLSEAIEDLRKLLEQAEIADRHPAASRLPAPRAFDDLKEADFEMPSVLIDGIVHRGGKVLFSAPSKARKTWALIYLLLCVQAGREWWSFPTIRAKSLLIDCELFQPAAYNRIKLVANAARIWDTSGIVVQSLRGQRLSLARLKNDTIDFCLRNDIGLIGIDPYYRLAAGQDENANNEIAEFLEGIEEIAHATGAAIALTHHYAKGNAAAKNSIDRMSGAGVFARDPDALIAMTEQDESDEEHPVFVIEPTIREFAPVKPFPIRWDFPLWIRDDSLGTTLKQPKKPGRPSEYGDEDLLKPLGSQTLRAVEWQRLCKEEAGLTSRVFYALKKDLLRRGLIKQTPDGFQAVPVETPKELLQRPNPHEQASREPSLSKL